MTITSPHDTGDDVRRIWRKAHRRAKFVRMTTAGCSLLLLGASLAFWLAPFFNGGAK